MYACHGGSANTSNCLNHVMGHLILTDSDYITHLFYFQHCMCPLHYWHTLALTCGMFLQLLRQSSWTKNSFIKYSSSQCCNMTVYCLCCLDSKVTLLHFQHSQRVDCSSVYVWQVRNTHCPNSFIYWLRATMCCETHLDWISFFSYTRFISHSFQE